MPKKEVTKAGEHDWFYFPGNSYESCRRCTVVKRADGKPQKPCPGVVKLSLRKKRQKPGARVVTRPTRDDRGYTTGWEMECPCCGQHSWAASKAHLVERLKGMLPDVEIVSME